MKKHRIPFLPSLAIVCTLALPGCGGGGSLGDGQTPLAVVPEEVVLTSRTDSCPPALGPTFYMVGGTPPFTLRNPLPQSLALDRMRVTRMDEGVVLSFKGGCLDTIALTVIDDTGATRQIPVSYRSLR